MVKPEETLPCPYNPAHLIRRERFQYHLVKCQRVNKPVNEFSICPLEATHRVHKPEMLHHVSKCDNRSIIERHMYSTTAEANKPVLKPMVDSTSIELPEPEENWDDDPSPQGTYNPEVKLCLGHIYRAIRGATKSERKFFRKMERLKFQRLNGAGAPSTENKETDPSKFTIREVNGSHSSTLESQFPEGAPEEAEFMQAFCYMSTPDDLHLPFRPNYLPFAAYVEEEVAAQQPGIGPIVCVHPNMGLGRGLDFRNFEREVAPGSTIAGSDSKCNSARSVPSQEGGSASKYTEEVFSQKCVPVPDDDGWIPVIGKGRGKGRNEKGSEASKKPGGLTSVGESSFEENAVGGCDWEDDTQNYNLE